MHERDMQVRVHYVRFVSSCDAKLGYLDVDERVDIDDVSERFEKEYRLSCRFCVFGVVEPFPFSGVSPNRRGRAMVNVHMTLLAPRIFSLFNFLAGRRLPEHAESATLGEGKSHKIEVFGYVCVG